MKTIEESNTNYTMSQVIKFIQLRIKLSKLEVEHKECAYSTSYSTEYASKISSLYKLGGVYTCHYNEESGVVESRFLNGKKFCFVN